jgi:hypothetical protein
MSADSDNDNHRNSHSKDSGEVSPSRRDILLTSTALIAASALGAALGPKAAAAQQQPAPSTGKQPNILVIWGDDIGQGNISAYTKGLMGYRTPNINRVANEGMIFTDEQRAEGTLKIWANPFTELRVPKIFNLRRDPYERADITSNTYYDWMISRAYMLVPAQAYVGKFLETFKTFPPRQKPASFTVGGQMEALEKALSRLEADIQ